MVAEIMPSDLSGAKAQARIVHEAEGGEEDHVGLTILPRRRLCYEPPTAQEMPIVHLLKKCYHVLKKRLPFTWCGLSAPAGDGAGHIGDPAAMNNDSAPSGRGVVYADADAVTMPDDVNTCREHWPEGIWQRRAQLIVIASLPVAETYFRRRLNWLHRQERSSNLHPVKFRTSAQHGMNSGADSIINSVRHRIR